MVTRGKLAEMTDEETTVLRWLGTIDSEFNQLGRFSGGFGITSRRVGGLWGEIIPSHVIASMETKGWIVTAPLHVTEEGRRAAAMVRYDLIPRERARP